MATQADLVGPYADMIKKLIAHYTGQIGKKKERYGGDLKAARPEEWDMAKAMLMKKMKSGGPDAWKRTQDKAAEYASRRRPTRRGRPPERGRGGTGRPTGGGYGGGGDIPDDFFYPEEEMY